MTDLTISILTRATPSLTMSRFFGCAEGEVEDASVNERPAVIYFDDDGFAIAKVRDADYCAEGQFAVCGGQAVHVVDFTAGCWSSVKFVRVVGCVANLR